MKRVKVSNNVIRRLPRYLRKLDELQASGINRISSFELGQQLGLTPSQIRQDFSCFGEFGQQGYGYNVPALRTEISGILGMDRGYTAILVGVGNIGHALTDNFCFSEWGFSLRAAFDVKPELAWQPEGWQVRAGVQWLNGEVKWGGSVRIEPGKTEILVGEIRIPANAKPGHYGRIKFAKRWACVDVVK